MSQKQPVQPVISIDKKRVGVPEPNAIVEQWRSNTSPTPIRHRQPLVQQSAADTVRVACVYLPFQYGRTGFIVMEYVTVDGTTCDKSDTP
ncbi:hypothetical protein V8D89_012710 [Ganoderma adspersum]